MESGSELVKAVMNELHLSYQMDKMSICNSADDENSTDEAVASIPSLLGEFAIRSHRKLLILDLNGILADIVTRPPKAVKPDAHVAKRGVFRRPFSDDFMRFCFERFEVGVWSSRNGKNVAKVVDILMKDLKHKLLFCWDQSHCTITSFRTLENKHKSIVFKELRKVWEKEDYDESNTLLVDDSPYKGLLNPPNTAIYPHSYTCEDSDDISLGPGGDIRDYLQKVAEANSVQTFVKLHPFGQTAITKDSESWEFYSKVINSVSHLSTEC